MSHRALLALPCLRWLVFYDHCTGSNFLMTCLRTLMRPCWPKLENVIYETSTVEQFWAVFNLCVVCPLISRIIPLYYLIEFEKEITDYSLLIVRRGTLKTTTHATTRLGLAKGITPGNNFLTVDIVFCFFLVKPIVERA